MNMILCFLAGMSGRSAYCRMGRRACRPGYLLACACREHEVVIEGCSQRLKLKSCDSMILEVLTL